jgi:hypothetical protein
MEASNRHLIVRVITQAFRSRTFIAEVRVQSQANPRGICGGQSGNGPGFSEYLRFPLPVPFQQCSLKIPLFMYQRRYIILASDGVFE